MSIIPALQDLPAMPKRIIMHWTAGGPEPSSHDLKHYHYCVGQSGEVFMGRPVELNMKQLGAGDSYAAHTRGFNSFSVGVAWCGMLGAKEGGPFGDHPITRGQTDAACGFIAELCYNWSLPVWRETVFTHWEAQALHRVEQRGKWDITVLPWLPRLHGVDVGDFLRLLVKGSAFAEAA